MKFNKNASAITFKVSNIDLHDSNLALPDQIVVVKRQDVKTYQGKTEGRAPNPKLLSEWKTTAMNHISEVVCPAMGWEEQDVCDCKIKIVAVV